MFKLNVVSFKNDFLPNSFSRVGILKNNIPTEFFCLNVLKILYIFFFSFFPWLMILLSLPPSIFKATHFSYNIIQILSPFYFYPAILQYHINPLGSAIFFFCHHYATTHKTKIKNINVGVSFLSCPYFSWTTIESDFVFLTCYTLTYILFLIDIA